jgi:Fe-S cluster biogenesis protein NfuA
VQEDTVYIRLEGGCQGCGMADVTLKQGIEVEIKKLVPEIVAVRDTTDHAVGSNPYFSPGK